MKITFVIYGLGSGGAERAVSGLANYWVKEHSVSIITLVKSKPFYAVEAKVKLHHCLENAKTTTNTSKSLKDGYTRLKKLKELLKKDKPDVVISFMTKTNIYALWAAKSLNIPCIVSERANHELNRLPRFHEWLRNVSYKRLSALVVQTQGNQQYYARTIPVSKIKVIPNAVAQTLQTNRTLVNEGSEKIILNVGAFRKAKAQDVLLKAFAMLPPNPWKLLFLGQGPFLENQQGLAKNLGIADKVQFLGAKKDVASYYNQAKLFVFTSEHEGFPNALLEALYFGLPCISTDCPHGPADMISDGENGFLVPVGNVDALAERMKQLMNSEKLQATFRKNAIISTRKYEMEPIAAQWMEVIQNVVA